MTGRRAPGEALALVLKALREHPRGLTTKEVAAATGIEQVLCGVHLNNYRSVNKVESIGPRPLRWFICKGASSDVAPQLVTPLPLRSIFIPPASPVSASFALATSRVIREQEGCVKADDFSEGAFLRDWHARRSSGEIK